MFRFGLIISPKVSISSSEFPDSSRLKVATLWNLDKLLISYSRVAHTHRKCPTQKLYFPFLTSPHSQFPTSNILLPRARLNHCLPLADIASCAISPNRTNPSFTVPPPPLPLHPRLLLLLLQDKLYLPFVVSFASTTSH